MSTGSAIANGLRHMCAHPKDRGIVSAFGFAPSHDIGLATAYCAAGFRKTGALAGGIEVQDGRKGAILWTRKLSNPADDDN